MIKLFIYILISFTLFLFYLTNSLLAEPYMDEIFHFPQAVKYYNGVFSEWDPKITTPPGLYLFTVGILNPLSKVTGLDVVKISCFRVVNITFTTGTIFIIYKILKHLHKGNEERVNLLSAFNITMFPVLYFFNFLYYTDCGSTFFVLLMYYWHLKKFYYSAAAVAAISVLFRQTNIVWVFFVAADETARAFFYWYIDNLPKKDKKINLFSLSDIRRVVVPLVKNNWKKILTTFAAIDLGYILVAVTSVLFVLYNGSIALGDKSAHQACVHVPQLFYFLIFFNGFAFPYLVSLSKLKEFVKFVLSHKMFMFELVVLFGCSIMFLSHAHPYLLADNRHYTFYLWRKVLGRNTILSLALIPLYIFSGWAVFRAIHHKDIIFIFTLAFCIVVSVIPQKLLEFRYFILPYMMLRLHLKVESKWMPFIEFIWYSIINFIVLFLFLFQRLPWDSNEKDVRIMW